MQNTTSRKNGLCINSNGVDKHTAPATAVVTKTPAPKRAPRTNSGLD